MEKEYVDLLGLQSRLKEGIECLFPQKIWLKAEIAAMKVRPGGHCYLELSQSSGGTLVAKVQAAIWASRYRILAPYFEKVTGSPLSEGLSVLVRIQVTYSQLYGLTLSIDDIDADFSLGDLERVRQETVRRLREEGLIDMQQSLPVPRLPFRLAVVSAPDAAGYRDFVRHLEENEYGFKFWIDLYPALMQGREAPESIVVAMDAVLESGKEYDAVLILRGGGARLDLACYDDYQLCSSIAQFPLPVFTAVGHDQDYHVCDMVARVNVKTPTALADWMVSVMEDEDALLSSCSSRIRMAFSSKLLAMESAVEMLRGRIRSAFSLKLSAMESRLEVLKVRIAAADPRNVLKRGFALVLDSKGAARRGASAFNAGDRLSVMFPDGTVECDVVNVKKNANG